jgi:hypothetical protein
MSPRRHTVRSLFGSSGSVAVAATIHTNETSPSAIVVNGKRL